MTVLIAPIVRDALMVIRYSEFGVSSSALTTLLRIFVHMRFRGVLDSETYVRLVSLATNACRYAIQDSQQSKLPVVVTDDEQIPPPPPRSGLRLLCLRCQKTGTYQPVATLHPVPPYAVFPGRWRYGAKERPLVSDQHYIPLGLGLYLSPLPAHTTPAEVLARCAGHRQANALRPALGSVRAGGLSHG